MAKMAFLTANIALFSVFSKILQQDICFSIVFKAESKPKHDKKMFGGFS